MYDEINILILIHIHILIRLHPAMDTGSSWNPAQPWAMSVGSNLVDVRRRRQT